MKRQVLGLWSLLLLFILTAASPLQGIAQSQKSSKKRDLHLDVQQYMEILGSAITTLQGHYVDTIDWNRVLTAGIDAMLGELDPYCEFYSEEDQADFKTMTTGEYGGIGALIQQHGDTVVIANPYEGRPALEAGVMVGDAILAIDGESMIKKTTAQVSDKLRGQAGTTFTLKLLRPFESEAREVKITRRKIVLDAVPYYGWVNDSVAYISLDQFTDKAAQDVQTALMTLRNDANGHSLKGLVFDLRGNGGGLLEEAVKIVGMFVPKGSPVVETKAKRPEWNSSYRTNTNPIEPTLPLVCLVDRSSASASEILSGALQDLDRAVIMGERSFGKGLVQSTRPLKYNTLMKYTSAKYYIPSGRCIQALNYGVDGQVAQIPDSLTHAFTTANGREVRDGRGIKPDVELKPQVMSNLAFYLVREQDIFNYATRYRKEHATIPAVGEFKLSDEDYEVFKQQALANKKDSILTLLKVTDMAHELDSLKGEVKQSIESEIALRYYYQRGQAAQNLLFDLQAKEAAKLLADPDRMEAILDPKAAALKAEKAAKKAKKQAKKTR